MTRPSIRDTPHEVEAIFRSLPHRFRPDRVKDYRGVFHFEITGAAKPEWTIAIDDGGAAVSEGLRGEANCKVTMREKTFLAIETGKRNPVMAFVKGKIKCTNVGEMRRYDRAFFRFHDIPAGP